MSQLCFDRSSLIINVVLLCAALEVIAPVSTVPTRLGFDSYTWWEKHSPPPPPRLTLLPHIYLSISPLLFSLCLCFDLSRRGLTGAFTHLYFCTDTHTHIGLSGVSPEWLGYGGMCHSSIIDQIQLLSSTDHLEIHHCLCLMQTHSRFHTHKNLTLHSLKCSHFPPHI